MLHKFELDGKKFLLDVNSGTVHQVDELVWNLLEDYNRCSTGGIVERYRERYEPEEVLEALAEIEQLIQEGLLFSADPLAGNYHPAERNVVKSLCLHLAHCCNLSCRYCFAGQGRYGGIDELMSAETGRAAIDFLIAGSARRKRLEVDFFGGEPLMNFDVLKELVAYGREAAGKAGKEINFTVTTNAVLLNDEITRYLIENDFFVVLSLDGRREVHEKMRPVSDEKGSYDLILPKIKKFVALCRREQYIIRGTFTRHNLDFCADVMHMAGLGFERVSIEPVVASREADYAIQEQDLPFIFSQYEQLTREVLRLWKAGKFFDFYHFNIDLEGGPCLPKRLSGCGAGCDYLAVAPNGDLYPCHQFVGRNGYLMGNVLGGVSRPEIRDIFKNAHIYNKEECAGCWAKFYCSGGCHANAEMLNGSICQPDVQGCALARKRLECAIYLQVAAGEIESGIMP